MAESYARTLAKVVIAQIAEAAGFEGVQQSANDALAELLLRYISEIGSATHGYAALAGRTDCNIHDVLLAFQNMGISLQEVMTYAESVEDTPFAHAIPPFPVAKRPPLVQSFAQKGQEPPKHIPAYLPAFPEKHTYIDTPTFAGHNKDPREQKLAVEKAKKDAEKAVVKLVERAKPRPAAETEEGKSASFSNPFLSSPVMAQDLAQHSARAEVEPEASQNPRPMNVDTQPSATAAPTAWEDAGVASTPGMQPALLSAPLQLDWTKPAATPARTDLLELGFEDAFANMTDEMTEKGSRRRRPSLKAKAAGDPATQRAEQLLALGANAMALEEAPAEKAAR